MKESFKVGGAIVLHVGGVSGMGQAPHELGKRGQILWYIGRVHCGWSKWKNSFCENTCR